MLWELMRLEGPGPIDRHAEHSKEKLDGVEGLSLAKNKPPLRRCRIRLLCANPLAISCEGAWRLEWTLLARMTALKDSKASVANRIAGPNWRT